MHNILQKIICFTNRSCLSQSTSVDLTDVSWNQAQLSLSRGGLGMRSLMLHAPAAYIASVCSSGYGLQSLTHLTHAVELFNVCVAPADKISLDSLASSNINQTMLSSKLSLMIINFRAYLTGPQSLIGHAYYPSLPPFLFLAFGCAIRRPWAPFRTKPIQCSP